MYKQSSTGSSAQYQLVQTLQGNTSSVTGFGADVGAHSKHSCALLSAAFACWQKPYLAGGAQVLRTAVYGP